jgi:thiamine biosynthesis lipoprotein
VTDAPIKLALTLTLLVAAGCEERLSTPAAAPSSPSVTTTALSGATMGTTWTVKIVVDSPEASQQAAALRGHLQGRLDAINKMMSTWDPESELSRFNAAREGDVVGVSRETAAVVKVAKAMGKHTDGAFDVTLGPLIRLWGFDRGGNKRVPSAAEVEAARQKVGLDRLTVHDVGRAALSKKVPGLEVNLSGIAKGYGVDALITLLKEKGITRAMVEIGGEVATIGKNAKGQPWTLGINVPRSDADPTAVLRTVSVEGKGLATSGNYRNFFEQGGKRYAHVLDPVTGEPTDHNLVSVTVLAPDCMTADGLATAGLVMGEAKLREVLAAHYPGVEALFVHAPLAAEGATSQQGFKVSKTAGFPDA